MAKEFLDAFEDSLNDAQDGLATRDDLIGEVDSVRVELLRAMSEMETRIMNRMYVALGVLFMALAALMALLQVFGD